MWLDPEDFYQHERERFPDDVEGFIRFTKWAARRRRDFKESSTYRVEERLHTYGRTFDAPARIGGPPPSLALRKKDPAEYVRRMPSRVVVTWRQLRDPAIIKMLERSLADPSQIPAFAAEAQRVPRLTRRLAQASLGLPEKGDRGPDHATTRRKRLSEGSAAALEQARRDLRKRESELADEFGDEFAARIEVREETPRVQREGERGIAFETAALEFAAKRVPCSPGAFQKRLADERRQKK